MERSGRSTIMTDIWRKTLGPALARPLGILLAMPLLVIALGVFITWSTWRNQTSLAQQEATKSFEEAAQLVRQELSNALSSGDAVLRALRQHLDQRQGAFDAAAFGWEMRSQFWARPTLAYIGYGTATGNYFGVYPDDSDEIILTQRVRQQPSDVTCRLEDFSFGQTALESIRVDEAYGYDPRTRPWYADTIQADTRIASAPYVWFDSGIVGVTVSEPYRAPGAAADTSPLGVIEIDFNTNSLSMLVEDLGRKMDALVFIYSDDHKVLAFPGLRQQHEQNKLGQGEMTVVGDLPVAAVQEFFANSSPAAVAARETGGQVALRVGDKRWLASVQTVALPGERQWTAVALGSLDDRLAAAESTLMRSIVSVAVAVLLVCLLSVLFARHIIRSYVRVQRAERAAAQAEDAVRKIGAYNLFRILGEGGMGQVWLAQHGLLARPVAVKLIHQQNFDDMDVADRSQAMTRFEREAQTLAQLRSPNTITIYDFGHSENGDLFYAMELLDGMDLCDLVEQYGPQPLARVIPILIQAARSLSEAHEQGLVHRDIKPANIYLCRMAGEVDIVKVLDFGMVRQVRTEADSRLTMAGTVEGTPAYMAPEQARDRADIDGRADLYALALVGYFLLSGQEIFLRDAPLACLIASMNDPAPPISDLCAIDADHPLVSLLLGCLEKDPNNRPESMKVFIDALLSIPPSPEHAWTASSRAAWWDAVPSADFSMSEFNQDMTGKQLVRG
jgi:serine/threonine protein kinase